MTQPEGFINPDRPHDVYRLHKSLYGLKQAPRMWNKEMHEYLVSIGFVRISADPCVYNEKINRAAPTLRLLHSGGRTQAKQLSQPNNMYR